jgi:hypothetical protein
MNAPVLVCNDLFLGEQYTICKADGCMGEKMKNSKFCLVHVLNPFSVKSLKKTTEEAFFMITRDKDGDTCFELWKQ